MIFNYIISILANIVILVVYPSKELFPNLKILSSLKGFHPPNKKAWYVGISTIFGWMFFLYMHTAFKIEKLTNRPQFYPPTTFIIPLFCLFLYIGVHLPLKSKYYKLSLSCRILYIIITLIFYISLIISLTYSFNILPKTKGHDIMTGFVKIGDKTLSQKVDIAIFIKGEKKKGYSTKNNGKFFLIIDSNDFVAISSLNFCTRYNNKWHGRIMLKSEIPVSGDKLEVDLKELKSSCL